MERLKNMELKKTFLVLSASCVLVALLMLGLVFMICNSISSNFPSGGIEILADGSIVKMETPTETQQNILSMLGIIQIVSCIVLPMGGLALSGILYYHIKLKQPISTLRNGISRIRNHDLDFSMPVHSDDELGQLCTAFDTMREELLKSNQELWRQAEERKRLNAAFSHDLRNPITVLKGTIKLLRQGTADEQAIDRLESYTLRIEQYAEAMSSIQRLEQMPVRINEYSYSLLHSELEEAYYARLNLKRGRGRTAVTILSLVMSITVFVALQSFTGLLDASSSVQDMYFSDYAVTNETVGIPSEAVKTLAENDAVESVSTTRLSVFMPGAGDILPFETDLSVQSHETLQLVNVDEAQLQIYAPNLSAQDKQALKDGTGCLVKNPIAFSYGDTTVQQTDLTVGDTIQLGDRTLPVLGLIDTAITINNDGFTNGVQLIVNDEIYCSLLGNDSYSEVYPTLQDNADTDTFESWLDSWCSNYPGTHWLSYLQSSNEMIESFEQIKMLCWVLIIFIGIIGILNIINTVYSNIHTRVGEIGMQRAIGMSAASLYKTFLWEGAYYGIIASVIGAVFGYVCCIFVGAAQTDALQLVAVPVMAIVEAAIISIVACLLATAIPLRSIARMSIVDSIETVE